MSATAARNGARPSLIRRLGRAAPLLATAVLGAIVILFWAGVLERHGTSGDRPTRTVAPPSIALLDPQEGAPREFLYLDNARTAAYLSQLTGGTINGEKVSALTAIKRAGALAAGSATLSREEQDQGSLERTVTPTATSNFYALTAALHKLKDLISLPPLPSRQPRGRRLASDDRAAVQRFLRGWRDVREGAFVSFVADVRVPGFMRMYQTLRQAPTDSLLGRLGGQTVRAIGLHPRFPFTVSLPRRPDGRSALRLIMPARFGSMATESSLFFGELRIVAKVVYLIRPGNPRRYRDFAVASRFSPVTHAPAAIRARLHLREARLRGELGDYKVVRAPAAILLPIAIYK